MYMCKRAYLLPDTYAADQTVFVQCPPRAISDCPMILPDDTDTVTYVLRFPEAYEWERALHEAPVHATGPDSA